VTLKRKFILPNFSTRGAIDEIINTTSNKKTKVISNTFRQTSGLRSAKTNKYTHIDFDRYKMEDILQNHKIEWTRLHPSFGGNGQIITTKSEKCLKFYGLNLSKFMSCCSARLIKATVIKYDHLLTIIKEKNVNAKNNEHLQRYLSILVQNKEIEENINEEDIKYKSKKSQKKCVY